jgi:hypothetical protein
VSVADAVHWFTIFALAVAAAAVIFSVIRWGATTLWELLVSGLILGAAAGGLIAVFADGRLGLGVLLGIDIGGACAAIVHVLKARP